MEIREAVTLARQGNEKGYEFLYEETYKSKYYLALQYMKNKEAAQDVLQEAYIKAFSSLDKLENPDTFSGWLGTIVANTAKNALAKKNPLLFTDVAVDKEDENFEYQIEDDSVGSQPELSYTRQETQELVWELIDSLSAEQRLCILMFHIEGASISEIAAALNCSDNTVKSRLNYGRKNLKAKAEELQKKGYKLYGIAPIPLLLWLLRANQKALAMDGMLEAAGKAMAKPILSHIPVSKSGGASAGTAKAAANGGKTAAKAGFLHTAAGKIGAVFIGGCVVGGVVFYGVTQIAPKADKPAVQETIVSENLPLEATAAHEWESMESETPESEAPQEKAVQDDEYPELIAGNLTKQELAFVLKYGPEEIPEQGFSESEYSTMMGIMCYFNEREGDLITDYGWDANYRHQYSVEDINRLFSSFTDYRFTEDNDSDAIDVDGEIIRFYGVTPSSGADVEITSAVYTETEMKVNYTFVKDSMEQGTTTQNKVATLEKDFDGMYHIVKIELAQDTAEPAPGTEAKAGTGGNSEIRSLYEGVLQSIKNQEAGYQFTDTSEGILRYEYFTADLDGDGVQELVVGAVVIMDQVFEGYILRVFDCEQGDSGYQLKMIEGEMGALSVFLAPDGNGLYRSDFSRGTGQSELSRIYISDGWLVRSGTPDYEYGMNDPVPSPFDDTSLRPAWHDISDLEGLN